MTRSRHADRDSVVYCALYFTFEPQANWIYVASQLTIVFVGVQLQAMRQPNRKCLLFCRVTVYACLV